MNGEYEEATADDIATLEPTVSSFQADEHTHPSEPNAGNERQNIQDEQDHEAEEYAIKFLTTVLGLRGVRIEREHFIKTELHKRGIGQAEIARAIQGSPAAAGIDLSLLDEIAKASIEFERNKTSTLSFAAGVPGGFAMIATVPGDITQFYVHVFRVMQKLAYLYGWQSFLENTEDIDDETLGKLAGFLGVMMGVAGATGSLRHFALNVARPALEKNIANVALTKTAWYLPMKHTLRMIGVQVTKHSLARTVTKVVPLIGGAVSGGFTYVTFNSQSKRLMQHLRELPPPNVDADEYLAAVKRAENARTTEPEQTDEANPPKNPTGSSAKRLAQAAAPTIKNARSSMVGKLGALRRPKRDGPTHSTPEDNS